MEQVTMPEVQGLGDPGGVLFTLAAAKENRLSVDKDLFDTYLFLLRSDGVLTFNYAFRFQPLPVSDLLRDDLYNLTQAGFVAASSPVLITEFGIEWLKHKLPWAKAQPLVDAVGRHLAGFVRSSRRDLSRAVYARLTRPIPG